MWPLFVLIILIVLYPIVRAIADEDIERTRKKEEKRLKDLQEKKEAGLDD